MLKKVYRLTWKDINFLVRKKHFIWTPIFSFLYFSQYDRKLYNQFSIQVPVKLTKKAVKRNQLKRIIFDNIKKRNLLSFPIWWKYYKIFVMVNKKTIPILQNTIESGDKNLINLEVEKYLNKSFQILMQKLWKNI